MMSIFTLFLKDLTGGPPIYFGAKKFKVHNCNFVWSKIGLLILQFSFACLAKIVETPVIQKACANIF